MYIIQQTSHAENRYYIRSGCEGITTWGSKPGGAARFDTKEEALKIIERQLRGFSCEVVQL